MARDLVDYRLLNVEDCEDIEEYLRRRGWLKEGERVLDVSRAGEGNMNCTLRVCTELLAVNLTADEYALEAYWSGTVGTVPLGEKLGTALSTEPRSHR